MAGVATLTISLGVPFRGAGVSGIVLEGGDDSSVPIFITIDPTAANGTRTVTVTAAAGISPPFFGFTVIGGTKKQTNQLTSQ